MSNLQRLDLDINQLTEIKNLDNLTNLAILIVDSNQIINIQGVYKLKNLRKLYLSKNPIQSLKGIEHLTNLEELYLDNTKITSIVNDIDKLPNLSLLSINNRHRHIPFEEIRYLIEEKHIDVLPFKHPHMRVEEWDPLVSIETISILTAFSSVEF